MTPASITRHRPARRSAAAADLALVVALACHRTVDVWWIPRRHHVPSHLASAVAAVAAAVALGESPDDLGLAPDRIPSGVRRGLIDGGVTLAALAVASGVPAVGDFLDDPRATASSRGHLLRHALVEIPLGTALPEELVFRSVLLARARRRWSDPVAVGVQAVLFGLWHVLPALEDRRHNASVAAYPAAATVAPTVAATAVAGLALGRARLRAGSVVAPVVAHAVTNAGALALARWHGARRRRRDDGDAAAEPALGSHR